MINPVSLSRRMQLESRQIEVMATHRPTLRLLTDWHGQLGSTVTFKRVAHARCSTSGSSASELQREVGLLSPFIDD